MKNLKFLFLFIIAFIFLSACTTSYTVSYVTNTEEVIEAVNVDKGGKLDLPSITKEGYDFKGWFKDSAFSTEFDEDVEIVEDLTLYAKWEIKKYEVRFLDGNQELAKVTVEHGKNATAPANPSKEGYTFKSWDKAFTNITKNTVVYAQFDLITFDVKFVVGEVETTVTVEYGAAATAPNVTAPEGYVFSGWDKEFDVVHEDLVVTAEFERITFSVTFVDKNGTQLDTKTVNYGEAATAPADPSLTGYTFAGWDKEFSEVKSNLTIIAKYTIIEYDIEYFDGTTKLTLTPAKYTVEDTLTLPVYSKSGFLFVDWYLKSDFTGEVMTKITKGETGKIVLYAKTLDESITHEIKYTLNEGSWGWTVATVTTPKDGIDAYSNLPEIFMQDFYTYLKDNNLLSASSVQAGLRKTTWADFSKSYTDPVAIYNWASTDAYGGNYSQLTGYNQFFFESGSGNETTGELYNLVGGFLGTDGYKEKYFTLSKHIAYLLKSKYVAPANLFWTGGASEAAGAFVFDGYLYGTQGLLATTDVNHKSFNALRAVIPTPDKGYKYENDKIVEYTYDFLKDSMVAGSVATLTIPSRQGYFFAGWYENADFSGNRVYKINAGSQPAAMYYAKWEPIS